MDPAEATILTERQVEVLELREQGLTQREVADQIGTTASNVSAVERAARDNIARAERTLELVETISATATFAVAAGTHFGDLIERVYAVGDANGITVAYPRPELYHQLYEAVGEYAGGNKIQRDVEIGLTREGEVRVFPRATGPDSDQYLS